MHRAPDPARRPDIADRSPRFAVWPAAAGGLLLVALLIVGYAGWPDLADVEAQRIRFSAWHALHPVLFAAAYFAVFTVLTALCLPGASVLMLAGGASFGFVFGTALSTAASAIGALGTMILARRLLHPWVARHFGDRLFAFEKKVEERGAAYLFSLRVLPVMPFTIVNLLAGLTPMRRWTFLWVSALGMAPGTALYVYAGLRLSQVRSPADLLTPGLLAAFFALAALPWVVRRCITRGRRLTP